MDTLITEKLRNKMSDELFTPHGYVIIQDNKTKEILFEGHNLITTPGRDLIWNLFDKISGNADNTFNADHYEITDVAISDYSKLLNIGEVLKTENIQLSDLNDDITAANINNWLILSSTADNGAVAPVQIEDGELNGHYYKLFKIEILGNSTGTHSASEYITKFDSILEPDADANSTIRISTLGLILDETVDSVTTRKLFSRINFDPIFFNRDTDLNIQYFIYF